MEKMNTELNNFNSEIIQSALAQPEFLSKLNELNGQKPEITNYDITNILINIGDSYIKQRPHKSYAKFCTL